MYTAFVLFLVNNQIVYNPSFYPLEFETEQECLDFIPRGEEFIIDNAGTTLFFITCTPNGEFEDTVIGVTIEDIVAQANMRGEPV